MFMEPEPEEEPIIHTWNNQRLDKLFTVSYPPNLDRVLCRHYYQSRQGRRFADWEELIINRDPRRERDLREDLLFRDQEHGQPYIELERFCQPGFFRTVNQRINDHLFRGAKLFKPYYPLGEEYHFQSTAVDTSGLWNDLEPTCPRQLINKIRNFQLFLRAFIRHSLNIRATKEVLLKELDYDYPEGTREWTAYDDTIETTKKRWTYIQDVNSIKRFVVRLAAYEEVFDRQRYYLVRQSACIDTLLYRAFGEREDRPDLRLDIGIVDIIASYLSNEVHHLTAQQAVENPRLRSRDVDDNFFHSSNLIHARGDNTPLGNWGVSTLFLAFGTYRDLYDHRSPDYRVATEVDGIKFDLVRGCMQDVEDYMSVLSFDNLPDDAQDCRCPFTDYIISRSKQEVPEGLIMPIAWFEDTLVATQLRRI